MGEQNANSAITMRMNRMARRRKDGTIPVAAVNALISRLTNASLPDSAAAIAKGVVYAGMPPPAKTQRERDHMDQDVPTNIGDVSKRVIREVLSHGWGVSYTVVDGGIWMVELVTSIDEAASGPDRIEASVTWVNPDSRLEEPV